MALATAAVCASLSAALALFFPPEGWGFLPSFGLWLVGIPGVLAAMTALDSVGARCVSLPAWQRLPSGVRMAVLVLLTGAAAVVMAWVTAVFRGGAP